MLTALLALGLSATLSGPPVDAPTLSPEEVPIGASAVAWTVFEGTEIEPMEGTVLGLVRNFLGPERHVVLVRFEGEKVRHSGIVHGMSGSPVYVDGKLIGALALSLSPFPKDPVAGITPIDYMLGEASDWESGGRTAAAPWDRGKAPASVAPALSPLKTPLVVSGMHPRVLGEFGDFFERHGFIAVPGSAGGAEAAELGPDDLVPGAAISARLMDGDMSLEATGTVTHRDGDRIWAFGHPFTQLGSVAFPMAPARIVATLADQTYSYKISNAGPAVGTVHRDRVTAIVGELGEPPPMLPVRVRFTLGDATIADYAYRVVDDPWFTPTLVAMAVVNSVSMRWNYEQEATYELRGRIALADGEELPLEQVYSVAPTLLTSSPAALASDVGMMLAMLYQNPLEPAPVTGVELEYRLSEGGRLWRVQDLQVDPEPVRPGDSLRARLLLQRFGGETRRVDLEIPVPLKARDARLAVRVVDASTLADELRAAGSPLVSATELGSLIHALKQQPVSDRLTVQLVALRPDPVLHQQRLPALPPSALRVMAQGGLGSGFGLLPRAVLWQQEVPVDGVALGAQEIQIQTRR